MAVIFKIIPKIGPFKAIAFKMPNPDTETLYLKSVNYTVDTVSRLTARPENRQAATCQHGF